ncbi:hypothetical protein [Flavobacterium sp. JAS]|uniref:hypothetical protein n=1 Tax=Flavobacterium sp. JAS TaxID=2897329 RepID=UPI001E40F3A4|nr:hypothetical protein [Flavobacterium sp. JAS]MCD0471832.1 hypothetical protein [Flavobacterium sp. JAS]
MRSYNKEEKRRLKEIDEQLTAEMKKMQATVLKKYHRERDDDDLSISSLHGTIGGKNNTYVDSVNMQFSDPNDFKAKWIRGFRNYVENRYSPLKKLMKDETFRNYTLKFLERNFYRNLKERTRVKPNENLWSLWFGGGKFIWGLVIAPTFRDKIWTNDVSEIRRAEYMYWTVGHVLNTGLVDPENNELVKFKDIDELLRFYKNILKRVSNSQYEKSIFDFYVEYLENSDDILSEPFLIPEFRYEGLEVDHKYRLDFTILNSHTMELIGFELSPHSSHMSVTKIKDRKQVEVNAELSKKWNKEMQKRNDYFEEFAITTVTFSDDNLNDIKKCFTIMKKYLSARPKEKINLANEIAELDNL